MKEEQKQKLREIALAKGIKPPLRTGCPPWNKGKEWDEATRIKMSKKHNITPETHIKMSQRAKNRVGKDSPNWQGGATSENLKIRQSVEYKIWRKAVFERDNYQCIWGGKEHGSKLHADHIKPFSDHPESRLSLDNGRTLCIECHKKTDTYLNNGFNKK